MIELDEIWKDDHLNRREDAEWLATFLRNRSAELARRGELRSFVLNLDATWGAGKSFFLTRLKAQLESASHIAVYVNAWRDDFADDPLVAVMAAIDEMVETHRELTPATRAKWKAVREKAGQIARISGKGLLKRGLGFVFTTGAVEAAEAVLADQEGGTLEAGVKGSKAAAEELAEGVNAVIEGRAEEEVSGFRKQQEAIQTFRDNLAEFIVAVEQTQGKAPPFFVLVDELDRCRPPYAIAMLERIKHLFETPGVVFVVATDSVQLGHAIRAVYGSGFESDRYLRRFFDQTYEFEEPTLESFVQYLMARSPIDAGKLSSPWNNDHAAFIARFLSGAKLDPRTAEQVYNHLHSMTSAWDEKVPLETCLALPVILAFTLRKPVHPLEDVVKSFAPMNPTLKTPWDSTGVRRGGQLAFSVRDIADLLARGGLLPLHEATNPGSHGGPAEDWVRDRFVEEFRVRAHSQVFVDRPMFSLIREYPYRVRQSGRVKSVAPHEPA